MNAATQIPTGPAWREFLRVRLGTSEWCVASRTTPKLRAKYRAIVTPKRWQKLEDEFCRAAKGLDL